MKPGGVLQWRHGTQHRLRSRLTRVACCVQDVLLVVYAPWCPYCQSLEAEVELLAASLVGQGPVKVAALRGDLQGNRAFSKEVLQVGRG
jgi:thiol-disulfide isomerase/thioredoxin